MAAKRKRQSYTKEQREAGLADVPTMGVSATARKHGRYDVAVDAVQAVERFELS